MYRSHHHDPQQGELCTAPRAKPGTKLSQHAHTSSPPGTKLSPHAPKGPFPRVLAKQGELYTASTPTTPSSENFVPHPEPNPVQNSPNTPTPAAQPVQNSPRMPQKAHFHAFWPSRENFVPHQAPNPVQNSPNTPTPAAQPVQNSPSTPTPAAQPVQNSPNTYKKAHFSLFCSSRENFVPPPPPRSRAGRTLYRTKRQTRYKTLPALPFYSGSAKKFAQHT